VEETSTDVTNEEVNAIIKKLKNKQAPGFDNISNEVVKNLKEELTPYLTRLYNLCVKQKKFPTP